MSLPSVARAQRVQVTVGYGFGPPPTAVPAAPPAVAPGPASTPTGPYPVGPYGAPAAIGYVQYLAYMNALGYSGPPPAPPTKSQLHDYFTNGAEATSVPSAGPSAGYFTNGAELAAPAMAPTPLTAPSAAPSAAASAAPYPSIPAPSNVPNAAPPPAPVQAAVATGGPLPAAPAPSSETVPPGVLAWIATMTRAQNAPPTAPVAATPSLDIAVAQPESVTASIAEAPAARAPAGAPVPLSEGIASLWGDWNAKVPSPDVGARLAITSIALVTALFISATAFVRLRARAAPPAPGPSDASGDGAPHVGPPPTF